MASRARWTRPRNWALAWLGFIVGCYQGPSGRAVAESVDDGGDDGAETGGEEEEEEEAIPLPAQPLHRLNRLEYNNTVRDLLGTTLRPADTFVSDTVANGFDNMAEQLGLPASLFHSYTNAARDVIDDALDDKPMFSVRRSGPDLEVAGGYAVGDLWALTGADGVMTLDVPAAFDAELVLVAGASVIGPAPQPVAWIYVDDVLVSSFEVHGSAANLQVYVVPITLEPGAHTVRVHPQNWTNDAAANTSNNVLVSSLEARSLEMGEGPGRSLVYVCDPSVGEADACFEEIIETFAFRAWRRPPSAAEVEALVELFDDVRQEGESSEAALRLVMRAIMSSPKFIYRVRTIADADSREWLDDYVLASRLSYFLWSSMPDERLFEAARQGRLSTEEGLSEAVAWMLEDDKARSLSDGFAEQWLSTRDLVAARPNLEIYPEFDEVLRASMVQESKLFFEDYLHSGLPVATLLEPSFAFRNDRLAEHYGMPAVGSPELVRVDAAPGERRGLLALGAWLVAQSESDHSSPIRRGVWISDRVLCTPVPPPPPGVEIDPLEVGGDDTVRERLERHRSDPQCAACHKLLDVLGMGFEEFDGIGRQILDEELDTLGELPDGRTFEGAEELAAIFTENEVVVGCITEKLFAYAVGRPIEGLDVPYLKAIAESAASGQHGLPAIIEAIVQAPPFRSPASLAEGS